MQDYRLQSPGRQVKLPLQKLYLAFYRRTFKRVNASLPYGHDPRVIQ